MEFPNPYQSPDSALPVINASQPAQTPPTLPAKFQPIEMITRLLQGVYLTLLAVCLLGALICFQSRAMLPEIDRLESSLQNPQAVRDPRFREMAVRHDQLGRQFKNSMVALQIIGGPIVQGITLVLLVAFVGWVYKASGNLPALHAEGATRSPAVAALAMLIPGVNLLAMVPVLNRLALGSDPDRWSPYGNKSQGLSLLVISWWTLNMLSLLGAAYVILAVIPNVKTRAEVQHMLGVQGALMVFSTLPVILAWWTVGMIHSNQEKRLRLVEHPPTRPIVSVVPEYVAAEGTEK